jgi:hypothetical protein
MTPANEEQHNLSDNINESNQVSENNKKYISNISII